MSSVFDLLPKEILLIIGIQLDIWSLSYFSRITPTSRSYFSPDEMTEMIRVKIQLTTRLDLSHYTKDQLGLLSKMKNPNCVISAGPNHSLVCNIKGQVFSFGYNKFGQLGLGDTENRSYPTLIRDPEIGKIIAVSAGQNHSLILNNQGRVYSFGCNEYGQLGLWACSSYLVTRPFEVHLPSEKSIVAVSAGTNCSLILDDQGQVFGFGYNRYGKLGISTGWNECQLGNTVDFYEVVDRSAVTTPRLIEWPYLGHITAISAGGGRSLMLNDQGQVFGFGDGSGMRPMMIPVAEDNLSTIAISAGSEWSLVLGLKNSKPKVFNFLCGDYNRMAIVDDEPQFVPTWLDEFREIEIAMISTGDPWSLALTTQGQVYRFGEADVRYNHSPKLLIGVQDIIAISTSDMSCLLLDAQGRIWAFGCNRNGQLGLGEIERQNTPILIEGLVVG